MPKIALLEQVSMYAGTERVLTFIHKNHKLIIIYNIYKAVSQFSLNITV